MKRSQQRRGGALIIALLTLMVVMLLSSAVLRTLLTARRQARGSTAALQAAWLAESAVDRALVRLATDKDYAGETWNVEIVGKNDELVAAAAQVTVKDEENEKWIIVSADFDGAVVRLRTRY